MKTLLVDRRTEKRRRKMKINQNSIFKRKKRKLLDSNQEQPTESCRDMTKLKRANRIENSPVAISRSRTKQPQNKMQLLISNSIILIIVQLICDISSQQAITLATTIDSDQTTNMEQQTIFRQKFASEPSDTFALIGQQAARLTCSVANKRGAVFWYREQLWISNEKEVFGGHTERYSIEQSNRLLLSPANGGDDLLASGFDFEKDFLPVTADLAAIAGPLAPIRSLSNYTLRIKNVALVDDGHYLCMVSGVDESNPLIRSRRAKLEVLQPPSRLEIQAKKLTQFKADEAIEEESASPISSLADMESVSVMSSSELQETPINLQPIERPATDKLSLPSKRRGNSLKHHDMSPRANSSEGIGSDDDSTNDSENQEPEEVKADDEDEVVSRIVVRENSRIKLDCRANQAKPSAKLVWLDFQGRPISKFPKSAPSVNGNSSDDGHHAQQLFAEELEQIDTEVPRLELISSSVSFRVKLEHHNQKLVCLADHKAFELRRQVLGEQRRRQKQRKANQLRKRQNQTEAIGSDDGNSSDEDDVENQEFLKVKPLRRQSILFEVHHAPIPELKRDLSSGDDSPREGKPLKLICQAQARPMDLKYRWFIDDQLVANATKSELLISSLTRQMHLREIKCEVRNSIGANTALIRLAVKYSPQYVTHLLPPSLQPDYQVSGFNHHHHYHQRVQHHHHHSATQPLRATSGGAATVVPTLSVQLALGYQNKQNLTLRCDFDSNPRPAQIKWFKQRSNYDIWQDISPQEADDLIAFGAMRALFKQQHTKTAGNPSEQQQQFSLNKRHISTAIGYSSNQIELTEQSHSASNQHDEDSIALDYEQMSHDLLGELELWQKRQQEETELSDLAGQHGSNNKVPESNETHRLFEQLHSTNELNTRPQIIQTTNKISEPVGWSLGKLRMLQRISENQNQSSAMLSLARSNANLEHYDELILLDHLNDPIGSSHQLNSSLKAIANNLRLGQRQAQLTSSFLTLNNLNEDSAGKYICVAEALEGYKSAARGLFLVRQQDPRIISANQQWAYLGAQQVQVECLAQISSIDDNQTQIVWSKDGKQIKEMHKMSSGSSNNNNYATDFERKVEIINQRSPDLLFMRSIVRIFGPEINDFGKYNCFIINSIGNDTMDIYFDLKAPEGATFNQLAYATIGSVCVFFVLICWLIACAPCQRLDSLAKLSSMVVASPGTDKMGDILSKNNNKRHSLKSPNSPSSSASSSTSSTTTATTNAIQQQSQKDANHDDNQDNRHRSQQQQQHHNESVSQSGSCDAVMGSDELLPSQAINGGTKFQHQTLPANFTQDFVSSTLNSMMLREHMQNHQLQLQLQQRPESAFEHGRVAATQHRQQAQQNGQVAMGNHVNNRHQFRSSLRQLSRGNQLHHQSSRFQSAANSNQSSLTSANNKKFAAIHESLENKLQFGPTFTRPTNFVQPISNSRQQQPQYPANEAVANQHELAASDKKAPDDDDDAQGQNVIVNNNCCDVDRYSTSSGNGKTQQQIQLASNSRLIDRIWSRLQMKSINQGAPINQSRSASLGKSKPTISLPMQMQTNSAPSTASDIYSNQQQQQTTTSCGPVGNKSSLLKLNSNGHRHLNGQISSSQANLIQDNTTSASDGTATGNNSGRSSSTSSANQAAANHHHLHQQQQLSNGQFEVGATCQQLDMANNYASNNYASSTPCSNEQSSPGSWPQHMYATDQQQQQMMQSMGNNNAHQMSGIYTNGFCTTTGDYANENLTLSMNFALPPSYPAQSSASQIYSPIGESVAGSLQQQQPVVAWPSPMMLGAQQADGQMDTLDHGLNVQDQQHYQMPVLMSESYLAAAVSAANTHNGGADYQATRSHYATICNNIAKQHLSMSPNSNQIIQHNSYSPTASVTLQPDGHCTTTTVKPNKASSLINGGGLVDGLATHV